MLLYIDDLIFTRNDEKMVEKFRKEMMKKYEMNDMGLFGYFLGIKVYQEKMECLFAKKGMLNISSKILAWLVAILYIYSFSCE